VTSEGVESARGHEYKFIDYGTAVRPTYHGVLRNINFIAHNKCLKS